MLAIVLALAFCENKTTLFYVTPRFSVLPVPLEMTVHFINETLKHNYVNESHVKPENSGCYILPKTNYTNDLKRCLLEKCFKNLLNSLTDLKLSTEKIDAYWEDTRDYLINKKRSPLSSESIFTYKNLYLDNKDQCLLIKKNQDINDDVFYAILDILNEIFNLNISDEKIKNCFDILQKNMKDIWIKKIAADYMQNNHNQIDTTQMEIIPFEVDFDCYIDKIKINKAFDIIYNKIEVERLGSGYILLEPAYYLHSNLSLSMGNNTTKKETINNELLTTYKFNNTIDTDRTFINGQKTSNWRIIVRVDYEKETIKKYIDFEHMNDNYHKFFNICCGINNHFKHIFINLMKLSEAKIIFNSKQTYESFYFLNSHTVDTLHDADE